MGQSETAVRSMTDFFLLLMLPGAGDELQGIKRGIIEMVDAIAINKADGDKRRAPTRAAVEYRAALHLFPAPADGWMPPVVTCSALTRDGIADDLGHRAGASRAHGGQRPLRGGAGAGRRSPGCTSSSRPGLETALRADAAVAAALPALEAAVGEGRTTALAAARDVLALFRR